MPEETQVAIAPDMSQIRAMLADPTPVKQQAEPTETSDKPVEVKTAEPTEAAAEPADKKLEQEETEEALPEAVTKRIAKESEKQAKIQGEIARAVSARKAAEHELAKEKELAAKGSQPVKPAQAADARPVKPILDNFQTYAEYQTAVSKYDTDHDAWLIAETRKASSEEYKAREKQTAAQATWNAAVKEHGSEFPALMQTVIDATSEPFQVAVSNLEDWPKMAVHLAKNPAELAEISAQFNRNPYQGTAALGRLQDKLKPAPKAAAAAAETLPEPPKKIGGAAAATGAVKLDDERLSFGAFKSGLKKALQS